MLGQMGTESLQASDGESGLRVFREQRPDVVLLDLRMPGMDGLDVISSLRTEAPETPVIVVSGEGTLDDAVQALRRGAWDFVVKPIFQSAALEHVINKALEKAALQLENQEQKLNLESTNRRLQSALQALQDDQTAGRALQFQLLPPDNRMLGPFSFSRRLFPSQYLSGDFIDYFDIDASHTGFYVADVSGHGAASAFVTAMLTTLVSKHRASFAAANDDVIMNPAALLKALDHDLRAMAIDKHITMFYGVLDKQTGAVTFSNGSLFPYPVLVDAAGSARFIESPGRPVGLFGSSQYGDSWQDLPAAGRLVIFSDGVLDKLPGRSLAEKRAHLLETVARSPSIIDLESAIGLDEGETHPDDVAILQIEWGAGGTL